MYKAGEGEAGKGSKLLKEMLGGVSGGEKWSLR